MRQFLFLLGHDLGLAWRQGWQVATTLIFFLLVVMLIAFGVGPDPVRLRAVAPGAIWVAAVLAALLSLDRIFAEDAGDGSLDIVRSSPVALEIVVLARFASVWLATGLPLALASPIAGILLRLPPAALAPIALALLPGLAVLVASGGAVAAIMLGTRRGGTLAALLVLPLWVPVLIFGAAAADRAITGGDFAGPLACLAALAALVLPFGTIGAAAALAE